MPTERTYQLVNPKIEGSFNDVYDAAEPIDAAKKLWENLSSHVANHVPNFLFTMKDISKGEYFHFQVTEKGGKGKKAKKGKYSISMREDLGVKEDEIEDFLKNVDAYIKKSSKKQGGGKVRRKRYDDSSSSDSSDEYYPSIKRTSPIGIIHYSSKIYYTPSSFTIEKPFTTLNPKVVGVTTSFPVFTPSFLQPISPLVAIWN